MSGIGLQGHRTNSDWLTLNWQTGQQQDTGPAAGSKYTHLDKNPMELRCSANSRIKTQFFVARLRSALYNKPIKFSILKRGLVCL